MTPVINAMPLTKQYRQMLIEIVVFAGLVAVNSDDLKVTINNKSVFLKISKSKQYVFIPTLGLHKSKYLVADRFSNQLFVANGHLKITGKLSDAVPDPNMLQDIHAGLRVWLANFYQKSVTEIYVINTEEIAEEDPRWVPSAFRLTKKILRAVKAKKITLKKSKIHEGMLFMKRAGKPGYLVISPVEERIYLARSTNPKTWRMQTTFGQAEWFSTIAGMCSWLH
jgi:hypothetical protein